MFDKFLRLSAALLLLLSATSAQETRGSIVGRAADASDASVAPVAPVAAAQVTVINKTEGTRQVFKSNGEGVYSAALLLPINDRVEVNGN